MRIHYNSTKAVCNTNKGIRDSLITICESHLVLQEKKLRVYCKKMGHESKDAVFAAFERYVKACLGNEVIGTPCKKPVAIETEYSIREASRKRKLFETIPEKTPISNFA